MSTLKFTSVGVPGGVATFAFPCSYSQRRFWFIDQLNKGSALYNVPFELRMKGPLDVEALKKALREIAKRHEVLRTVFVQDANGEPEQRVGPTPELQIIMIDLSELDFESRQHQTSAYIGEESSLGFDLAQGPLIRAKLLRLANDDHLLLLNMHHIVSDGWSLGILGQELTALYDAFVRGLPSPLPELPIQYCDYAVWLRDWVQSGALQPQLDYWTTQLEGVEPLELPTTYSRPAVSSHRGATYTFRLSTELTEKLTRLSRRENVTIFMTLLAGFQILLARYTSQKDFVVGTPVAGRGSTELERLIGCFVNTLVMRARLNNTFTVKQ